MVNFVCQLVLGIECLDIYSNIIMGDSVRVVLDEIRIQICGLEVKQIAHHYVGGPYLISWRLEYDKNNRPPLSNRAH